MIVRLITLFANRGGPDPVRSAFGGVLTLVAILAALVLFGLGANAAFGSRNCSAECVKRVERRQFAKTHGGCYDRACVERVERKRLVAELARYHADPMPSCTWDVESGPGLPQWAASRYVARNLRSTAAGKFQFLDSTWHAIGGKDYVGDHDAARAMPVVQERLARVLRALNGLRPWILC